MRVPARAADVRPPGAAGRREADAGAGRRRGQVREVLHVHRQGGQGHARQQSQVSNYVVVNRLKFLYTFGKQFWSMFPALGVLLHISVFGQKSIWPKEIVCQVN